jgi:ribonuclease BN (tRNA processing enzyme)
VNDARRYSLLLRVASAALVCVLNLNGVGVGAGQAPASQTKVVLLGTGTPNADPDRWGPGVAVVVGNESYLVDAGVGVVRRAAAAARDKGLPALAAARLRRVFITHLHSDHTLGLPDLMFSPWVLERQVPLDVYGPVGIREMTGHLEAAYRADIDMRLYGLEPQSTRNYRAIVREIEPGLVYEDARVKVDAIAVPHGSWPEAFAFRFRTADRMIVISGDTRVSAAIADACNGCDVLVHEVYSAEKFKTRPPEWQTYHASFHISTVELAELAARAKPKLLVLYHQLFWGATDADLEREIRAAGYMGRVVSGRDLDVF